MGGDQPQTVPGPLDGGSLPGPVPAPTLPSRPGARGPTSPAPSGGLPPTPGAARLAPRTEAPAPSSHETRAGTVRARVVQRAVTLWRLPPPPRAHGVLAAGTRRRGVGGEGGLPPCVCPHVWPGWLEEVWEPGARQVVSGRVSAPRCPRWRRALLPCGVAGRKRRCFSRR